MTTHRTHTHVALAAALVVAASVTAAPGGSATPASRLAPTCLSDAGRTSACRLIVNYFSALNAGHSRKACSLLGQQLRIETGGPNCPSVLSMSRGTPFEIVGARTVPTGVAVLVKAGIHELDHFRMLSWIASVGREGGQLRILDTQLT
jgi:hypothetical protein